MFQKKKKKKKDENQFLNYSLNRLDKNKRRFERCNNMFTTCWKLYVKIKKWCHN